MAPLNVELSTIEEGVNEYEFRVGPEEIDLEEEGAVFRKAVNVRLTVTRTGPTLTLRGKVWTDVERTCGKCLARFDSALEAEFFEAVRLKGDQLRVLDDQYDGDTGFLNELPGVMTIEPLVRESILVSSPMQPVCRPDCKGLCPVCGADRNVVECGCSVERRHPAWDQLRKLTQELEKRE